MSQATNLKGLEIAHTFCEEWVIPFLRSEFPKISERAACVLFGGSQSLRNDDDLSHDHGWGPAFDLFLQSEDAKKSAKRVQQAINTSAPKEWLGARWSLVRGANVKVRSLDAWMRQHMRYPHPPKSHLAWLRVDESQLYMMRHCSVFHDPLGDFSQRKEAYHSYPYEVWLQRVWDELFSVWHYGEYNFCDRMVHREDRVAIAMCIGSFVEATMRLCLLLNDDFTPYWKWLAAEFRKLPNVEELDSWLNNLIASDDLNDQAKIVKLICRDVFSRLVNKGLVTGNPEDDDHCLKIAKQDLRKLMA